MKRVSVHWHNRQDRTLVYTANFVDVIRPDNSPSQIIVELCEGPKAPAHTTLWCSTDKCVVSVEEVGEVKEATEEEKRADAEIEKQNALTVVVAKEIVEKLLDRYARMTQLKVTPNDAFRQFLNGYESALEDARHVLITAQTAALQPSPSSPSNPA